MIPVDKRRLYEKRLLHLLDFTILSCYKVKIASSFLFAAAKNQRVDKDVRDGVLIMMIAEMMILTAARLIDERKGARSLKVFEKYAAILGEDVHGRIRLLVQKAYDSRTKVLRDLRHEWLAHVSQEKPNFARTETNIKRLDPAVTHVIRVAEEIAAIVAEALGKRIPGMDEYLEDHARIQREKRPENLYEW